MRGLVRKDLKGKYKGIRSLEDIWKLLKTVLIKKPRQNAFPRLGKMLQSLKGICMVMEAKRGKKVLFKK